MFATPVSDVAFCYAGCLTAAETPKDFNVFNDLKGPNAFCKTSLKKEKADGDCIIR